MEWHAGNTLSQTLYTFLYGHAVAEMHTDYLLNVEDDPLRPIELVTVVLRAVALAVMKRCSTAWAGMAKGGIRDVSEPPAVYVTGSDGPLSLAAGGLALREGGYISTRKHPGRPCVRGVGSSHLLVVLCDARQGDSLLIKHFRSLSLVFTISSPAMERRVITQGVISQGRLNGGFHD